ncbi:PCI-domain-containing protein [Pseudovirgaria hyperparasitica]|uniref:PCI-domain-containing protein n=1 Tax=Pseudovirgaria hyperparasitica TaxID=470096 RepID=A0A6A6WAN9_9PEZI|nr:PCI-domain-containing protein [Pseudovirgaria hyperparasitica]KAF2758657.1 PCI-domain-containing protein [Pseudovirgaria hyperparasitica]
MPSPSARRPSLIKTPADDPLLKLYIPPSPTNISAPESLKRLADILEGFHIFKIVPETKAISEDEIKSLKQAACPLQRGSFLNKSGKSYTMEQSKALNALEPFLALSKAANSPRAAADVVMQATGAKDTYVFAELLQMPNILKLGDSELKSHLKLLQIFAWGSWSDYVANQDTLPKLSEAQTKKLKLLSLISLSTSHESLKYPALQASLDLPSQRALESHITDAIYAGLVTGTMDPLHQLVHITSVAPLRDLAPGSVPQLQKSLAAWSTRCEDALKELDIQAAHIRSQAKIREDRRRQREAQVKAAMEKDDKKGAEDDVMDLDDDGTGKKGHRSGKGIMGGMGRLGGKR